MRPIDLTPEGERRGRIGLRTGPLPYLVIGGLLALLAGAVLYALTANEVSERESEIVTLEREAATASAEAMRLQPYVEFHDLKEARTGTVVALADSRFDWVRTIRQLALVIPSDVWLVEVRGEASGGEGKAADVAGPSLTVVGCAEGQDSVAAFVAAAKQIDGVTRVGLSNSVLPQAGGQSGAGGGSEGGGCPGGVYIASFEAVLAFDDAPQSQASLTASTAESGATEEGPQDEEGGE